MAKTTFRDQEKARYLAIKNSGLFSPGAIKSGTFRGHTYPFCLADGFSSENLFTGFRQEAIQYFKNRHIPWHDGTNNRTLPSNHLCCSQSCCVNFLFPMVADPIFLNGVFKSIYPQIEDVIPMVGDAIEKSKPPPYLSFEWIGLEDYLGETQRKPGSRTRGAHYTSADFAFRFRRNDGKIQIVLGEWKYTEYYRREDKGENPVRLKNYKRSFDRVNGTFPDKSIYRALFFEPFYQLMRLQLLAQEMEEKHEMGADIVSILHVTPKANKEFSKSARSPELIRMYPGLDVISIWKRIVGDSRFASLSAEELLSSINQISSGENKWNSWLNDRYTFNNW